MNNTELSKSFQAHITYDVSIRAIDLENIICAIRLFAQDQMRIDKRNRIQEYTDCVKISGIDKGSIVLNFDLNTAINIAQLVGCIAGTMLAYKTYKKSSDNKEPWKVSSSRDLSTATTNGVGVYIRDEYGNVVDICTGQKNHVDLNQNKHFQVGDKVRISSGGPIMTVISLDEENATCIFFSPEDQIRELIVPIAGLVK